MAAMLMLYRWLWTLGPGNPILLRVVQGGSQRVRHLWIRMGYLGILICLVLLGLLYGGGMAADHQSLTDLAKAGAKVFVTIAYGQVILVCLIAPIFMAGAIAQEHASQTFDILLTTPLTNLQIVLGTLLGRLLFILALLASGIPLFSVLLLFGGVPMESIIVSFAVAGLTAIFVASVAIMLAVMRTGGRRAVFTFVVAVAAYLIMVYLADAGIQKFQQGAVSTAAVTASASGQPLASGASGETTVLTPLHPLLVLKASFGAEDYTPPAAETLADRNALVRLYLGRPLAMFTLLTLGLSLVMVLWSTLSVRRVGEGGGSAMGILRSPRIRRLLRLRPVGERRRPPRTVWQNPVAWREANTRGKLTSAILARWSFAAVGLLLGAVLLVMYHTQNLPAAPGVPQAEVFKGALAVILLVEITVAALVALYMSASCVSREREDGTLDLMLTTPLTPAYYIWGKLRGLIGFLALMLAVPILTLAMVSVYTWIGSLLDAPWSQMNYTLTGTKGPLVFLEAPLLLALILIPFAAACVAAGMYCSLRAKGVLGAVVPAAGFVGMIVTIFGFCGMSAAGSTLILGSLLGSLSPVSALIIVLNPIENVDAFEQSREVGRLCLLFGAGASALIYGLIVRGMIGAMVKDFDQTMRKLSGTA